MIDDIPAMAPLRTSVVLLMYKTICLFLQRSNKLNSETTQMKYGDLITYTVGKGVGDTDNPWPEPTGPKISRRNLAFLPKNRLAVKAYEF